MPTFLAWDGKQQLECKWPDGDPPRGPVTLDERVIDSIQWRTERIPDGQQFHLLVNGKTVPVTVQRDGEESRVWCDGFAFRLKLADKHLWELQKATAGSGGKQQKETVKSSMPGRIVSVLVNVGDVLEPDSPVVAMEAMKMVMNITTSAGGRVTKIPVSEGDSVKSNAVLCELVPVEEE